MKFVFRVILTWFFLTGLSLAKNMESIEPVKVQEASIEVLENRYQRLGSGKLTWFGFSVYKSAFYTASGNFSGVKSEYPLMLVIEYQRDIDKEDLIDRTYKEWKRLPHYDEEKFKPWRAKLNAIWPEIKEGDRLACVIEKDRTTTFYGNQGPLGKIEDPDFGWNFISIWLAETTSEKSLRKKLLGIK